MALLQHGHSGAAGKTVTYWAWQNMKARCDYNYNERFKDYGGRGISYDPAWKVFSAFLRDMGEKPEPSIAWSLDRVDNSKDYCKSNCRWATTEQQAKNKRKQEGNSRNVSGITGVSFCKRKWNWVATGRWNNKNIQLYQGKDFFEACCARKSWEANNFL